MSDTQHQAQNNNQLRPMPSTYAKLALDGTISAADFAKIARGYVPKSAADKWVISFANEWLFFHRATTRVCVFALNIRPNEDHYLADKLLVNRDPTQYRTVSDDYDVQLMAHLIDRYLLGRNSTLPVPAAIGKHNRALHEAHVLGQQQGSSAAAPTISLDSLLNGLE